MWENASVAANRQVLLARGVRFVGPASGLLASGHEGLGRMEEPEAIVSAAADVPVQPSTRDQLQTA